MLRKALRALVRVIATDYWNGWLYVLETCQAPPVEVGVRYRILEEPGEVAGSPHEEISKQSAPLEGDTWGFGAWQDGEIAAVCWFHARDTYRRRGGMLRLANDEAELGQITTAVAFRSRGLATELIRYGAWEMRSTGFRRLYARIWHDNTASIRAFERAGWKPEKRFFSLRLHGCRNSIVLWLPRMKRR
jgi:RimJ/RimL family protein N-acetyltransferase